MRLRCCFRHKMRKHSEIDLIKVISPQKNGKYVATTNEIMFFRF